jgi:hypothetical protein
MQIIFNADLDKPINKEGEKFKCMRFNKHRVLTDKKSIIKHVGKKEYLKYKYTSITYTDPTPKQLIARIGRNYLGFDISKYLIIDMNNDDYLEKEALLKNAKDIKINANQLGDKQVDGSYKYSDHLFSIIPKDPPSAEELVKKEAVKLNRKELKDLKSQLRSASIELLTNQEKINMLFKYMQLKLRLQR